MSLDDIFPKLVQATRSASGLASNDINFYKSLDSKIQTHSENTSESIINLINQITNNANDIDGDTIKESWSVVSNIIDSFLENSDIAFDELSGRKKDSNSIQQTSSNNDDDKKESFRKIAKPQLKFKNKIDNSEISPFRPKLTSKPNSIIPFDKTFELVEEDGPIHYKQPYETEILEQEYNHSILEKSTPVKFKDFEATDSIWVDNVEELEKLVESLEKANEVAVDLEHHDYRSYYGIVCLMQISTRDQDWLIDTLVLRDDLQILNKIFTNPQITKIFHGAFMDIIWLQRDLGLYVVSLFDTYHASRLLGFPKHSLAYLLERFAEFQASKKYQLADWRIRPLTPPMRVYARADTHFLLYIYDELKNMLIDSNKLETVLYESRNVAVRRFEYTSFKPTVPSKFVVSPIEKDEPWKSLLYQYNISNSRSTVVQSLYKWRDSKAKEEDESPRYIMPNQLLVSLATQCPTDPAGVLNASNLVSECVRKNCKVVSELIKESMTIGESEDFKGYDEAVEQQDKEKKAVDLNSVIKGEKLFKTIEDSLRYVNIGVSFNTNSVLFRDTIEESSTVFNASNVSMSERRELLDKLNDIRPVELVENEDLYEDAQEEQETEPIQQEETEKSTMFEEKDDILVLRNNRNHNNNNNRKEKPVKDYETTKFDYTKADKIIKQPSFKEKREKEKEKKRSSPASFDPYSHDNDAIRPAKKKGKPVAGKMSSFVHKKRRN